MVNYFGRYQRRIIRRKNHFRNRFKCVENFAKFFVFTVPPSRPSRRPCTLGWNFSTLSQDRLRTRRSIQLPYHQGLDQPNTASDPHIYPLQWHYRVTELDSYLRQFLVSVKAIQYSQRHVISITRTLEYSNLTIANYEQKKKKILIYSKERKFPFI